VKQDEEVFRIYLAVFALLAVAMTTVGIWGFITVVSWLVTK
jgi:hypothetical protein